MAVTLVKAEGFEHGTWEGAGNAICTATGEGANYTVVDAGGLGFGIDNHTGDYCLRHHVHGSAATDTATINVEGQDASYIMVGSFYFLIHEYPSADQIIFTMNQTGNDFRIYLESTDHKLYPAWASSRGNGSAALSLDVWYLIDFRVDASANPNTIDMQVDGNAITQITSAQAASYSSNVQLNLLSTTQETFYDDMVYSFTSGDYPIGAHNIVGLLPTGEGTHNTASPTEFEDKDGNDIDGSHFAYAGMNTVPPSTANFIQQDTADGTASHYVEVTFADTAHNNILGVNPYVAYFSSGTNANNGQERIYDSDGGYSTVHTGSHAGTSLTWAEEMKTAPAGGWTMAHVNALTGRFGYSTDIDSIPYCAFIILQVAYGTDTATGFANMVMNIIG